jgi:IS5 family transposase
VANNVFFPTFLEKFLKKKRLLSLSQIIFRFRNNAKFRAKKMLIVRREAKKKTKKSIYITKNHDL